MRRCPTMLQTALILSVFLHGALGAAPPEDAEWQILAPGLELRWLSAKTPQ